MKRRHLLSHFCLLPLLCLTGCGKRDSNRLVIGMEAAYPPFEMLDQGGAFTGISAEMGRALGQHMGKEVQFKNIAFDGLVLALKSGEIDLVISSMTATEEKRKSIDFSDPYVQIGLALLVSQKSAVKETAELNGESRRIAVRLGTTGEAFARKTWPKATVLALDNDPACVMEVVKGGVDAWIYDQLSIIRYHDRHKDTTRALLAPVQKEQWAIGIRQGRDDLKQTVNTFLEAYRKSGGFQNLADKYLENEKNQMQAQGLPFVFDVGSDKL